MSGSRLTKASLRRCAVLVAAAAISALLVVADPTSLCLLPALALAALLLMRVFPGERTIVALSCPPSRRRRRLTRTIARPRASAVLSPRGGSLLARSLAVRPPPPARSAG